MYQIVCPFSRPENLSAILGMVDTFWVAGHRIAFTKLAEPAPPCKCPAYWKINCYIDEAKINPDDYYLFFCDDGWYAPDFFDKLSRHSGPVIVTSALRGDHQPPGSPHGISTLVASPQNMAVGRVDLGQLVMRGDVVRKIRFTVSPIGDGLLAEQLAKRYPIDYAPECFYWFNYLEPGRYDETKAA